jgi:hypothetical protein
MNHRLRCKFTLLICALLYGPGAGAHPEDSPLTFIPHRNDNGAVIYTNIPKKCFVNGRLLCTRYHPLFAQGGMTGESDADGE